MAFGIIIFVQLGFSSIVASDTVALTNFFKNFNFGGGLYFDSLVAWLSVMSLEWLTKVQQFPTEVDMSLVNS